MNKKSIPGAKSMKMSADDLKEMVKQAVKECLGDEEKDLTEQDDPTLNEGIMEVIEAAVEAATEKRKARKEAGEEVSEDLTADEVLAEAAAILDAMETGDDETKADDEETEEKEDDEETEAKAAKATKKRQTKTRAAVPAQRKYSDIYMARAAARQQTEKKKLPPEVQLARAVKCLDVFGRHDPEAAAFYAKKHYGDEDMAREFKAMSVTNPTAGGFLIPEIYLDEIIEMLYAKTVIFELGARKVPMANGNLNIPKMTSGARATWGGEARKIGKTQPTYGNIKLSAKRLEAIVPQTRELLMSTNYSADALFANDLTRRMELGLDFGAMFGTGGEFQPLGITANKDVQTVNAASLNDTNLASAEGKLTADFPVWLVSTVDGQERGRPRTRLDVQLHDGGLPQEPQDDHRRLHLPRGDERGQASRIPLQGQQPDFDRQQEDEHHLRQLGRPARGRTAWPRDLHHPRRLLDGRGRQPAQRIRGEPRRDPRPDVR